MRSLVTSLAASCAVALLGGSLIAAPAHAMSVGLGSDDVHAASARSAFTDGPISVLILRSPVGNNPGKVRMSWDMALDTSSMSVCIEEGGSVQYQAVIVETEKLELGYESEEYHVLSGSVDVELPAGKYAAMLDPFQCQTDNISMSGLMWMVEFTLRDCDEQSGNQYAVADFMEGEGAATVTLPDGSVMPLAKDVQVPVGSKVTTGGNFRVQLRTCDGSTMRVGPGTTMTLTKAYFGPLGEKRFSARLFFGRLWVIVSGVMGGNKKSWEVETRNAWVGVRGTTFCVTVDKVGGEPRTLVQVLDGIVKVTVKSTGQRVSVRPGQYAEVVGARPKVKARPMPPGTEPAAETCSG